jgi:uncharacterized protein (TIGR00255 family)
MTGFGKGSFEKDGVVCTVEIGSVNRKQLDIRFNQVPEIRAFESFYRKEIAKRLARGTVNVKIVLGSTVQSQVGINRPLLERYVEELSGLSGDLGISTELKWSDLLSLPDVVRENSVGISSSLVHEVTSSALDIALEAICEARSCEGEEIRRDLSMRMNILMEMVEVIRQRVPFVVAEYQERLKERVALLLQDTMSLDEVSLAREVAFFAERSDISEEITRLDSHFLQLSLLLEQSEPVGRNLDFLLQEIYREINTTGTKASDAQISTQVVAFKTELEKIREQVQNIE